MKTAWDTIIAPKEAFESIRAVPTWGWALAIAILLSAFGAYLTVPALQHAYASDWPKIVAQNHTLSSMPPERQREMLGFNLRVLEISWLGSLIGVPLYSLVNAIVMLVFDKAGRGSGSFVHYWAAACNIAIVPYGIQRLVLGIIALARGPQSYTSISSLAASMPSLALLAHGAAPRLFTFLTTINVFSIWSAALVILALLVAGRTRSFQAWLGGLTFYLYPTIVAVWNAH